MGVQSANVGFGGTDGAAPVTALPFRMLIVGNFLGRRLGIGEEAQAHLVRVDKESLKEALERLAPRVLLELTNHLGGPDKTITVDQTIKKFEDFRPEAVAAAQPGCAALLAARAKIEALAGQGLGPGQIASRLEGELGAIADGSSLLATLVGGGGERKTDGSDGPARPDADDTGGGSVLDDILEATAKPKEAPKGSAALSSVIGAIGGAAKKAGTKGASGPAGPALDWIDARVGKQLQEVLHAPEFAELEEAWRGLWFLVARSDFRKDLMLEILPAAKQDLRALLVAGALEDEWNQPGDPPLSVVIVDHLFDRTARDMDALAEMAQACERLQAPVVAGVNAGFFGLEALGPMGGKAALHDLVSDPQFAKWMGVRQGEPSRWLALTVNRFLLRRPWGEEGNALKGLHWAEATDEQHGVGLTWGNGVWPLAACMMQSFAREGWPHFISGPKQGGLVEDLPLRSWEARPKVTAKIPLETGLSDMQAQDLATAGVIPLQSAANADKAYFTYVPGAHLPKRYGDAGATQEAAMMTLLPYQLYAGRIAAWIGRQLSEEAGAPDGAVLAGRLKAKLLALLATASGPAPDSCAAVTVGDSPKNPDRYLVSFEIKPPFKLFNLTPRLEMNVELRK